MLPVAGVIVGALGLLIGGYAAFVALPKVNKTLVEHQTKIESVEQQAANAAAKADGAATRTALESVARQTQDGFTAISNSMAKLQETVTKLEESAKKPVATAKGGGGPVVAGPNEYIVKAGDGGAKIAREKGVALSDLLAVNPSVDWKKLHPGQKIKLPVKAAK